jgi:hypothetical protein
MPVGGETIICGQYTVTWNSVALGIMQGDAGLPTIEHSYVEEPIANTDAYGKTVIDGVYQGVNVFASMTCMEYRAGSIAAWWPFSTLGRLGVIGRLLYDMSSPLVLTAIAGTPAAASPATLTASKTILAAGFGTRLLFGPTVRTVPLRFRLYPYTDTQIKHFSTT